MARKKDDHPFFCTKKQIRKTAYDTPEYLTAQDIDTLDKLVGILERHDVGAFHELARDPERKEGLFYRILGWPEGLSYCYDYRYCEITAIKGLIQHELGKLKEANEQLHNL